MKIIDAILGIIIIPLNLNWISDPKINVIKIRVYVYFSLYEQ